MPQVTCDVCQGPLSPARQRRHAKYCTNVCARQKQRQQWALMNPFRQHRAPSTTGAISELRVSVDLMQKGFDVYRALSPSCGADLAILHEDHLFRIEVKTACRTSRGTIQYGKPYGINRFDILALVLPDAIIYKPDLP